MRQPVISGTIFRSPESPRMATTGRMSEQKGVHFVPDPDAAAIRTLMESMATFADRNEFEALERIFSDPVIVDYASLSGGEAKSKPSRALMHAWAGLLPGFDRTRHSLSDFTVTLSGETASGTCSVTADHWVDDFFWSVSGLYAFEFVKKGGEWQITRLTFTAQEESGTRKVFSLAMERASFRPVN